MGEGTLQTAWGGLFREVDGRLGHPRVRQYSSAFILNTAEAFNRDVKHTATVSIRETRRLGGRSWGDELFKSVVETRTRNQNGHVPSAGGAGSVGDTGAVGSSVGAGTGTPPADEAQTKNGAEVQGVKRMRSSRKFTP